MYVAKAITTRKMEQQTNKARQCKYILWLGFRRTVALLTINSITVFWLLMISKGTKCVIWYDPKSFHVFTTNLTPKKESNYKNCRDETCSVLS